MIKESKEDDETPYHEMDSLKNEPHEEERDEDSFAQY